KGHGLRMSRPDRRYVGLAAKSFGKELLWYLTCDHRQGPEPNILLFATRRGGSTFLMELISANRGVRSIDQPFEMTSAFPTAAQVADMPLFEDGQLTSLDERSARRLKSLTERIFAGEVVINAPSRVWRPDVERRSNRLVLKILDAKPLIGWFADAVPCDIVYLTRHPIPQAISCIRNRWTLTAAAYLRDERFIEANLSDTAVSLAHDVMRTGTQLEQFILNWALENVAPVRLLPEHPTWTHVRYEDCVTDPAGVLDTVAARLRLTDRERMHVTLQRPSVSSGLSTEETRVLIAEGKSAEIVTRWRRQLDDDTEAWCNRLLETFRIDPTLVLPST
ncbi:MAG: hypothetical protein ACSLFI_06080, partial [Solirubrobacterales bacterium]